MGGIFHLRLPTKKIRTRYARPYDAQNEAVDGLPNYFFHTQSLDAKLPLLESGINPIQKITSPDGLRCPAILISSSPHKIGSPETPWQDFFDPDNGHIHYYGDNKAPGVDPSTPNGNKALLEQFSFHTSPDEEGRNSACPIIFFKRVRVGPRLKGNVQFQGFGIISLTRLVTQFNSRNDQAFPNYAFDFTIFNLQEENEEFDWNWITRRRNPGATNTETLESAPAAWLLWVRQGNSVVERCRRRIVKLLTLRTSEQIPTESSREAKTLRSVYAFYSGRKARFEALAAFIAERVIGANEASYRPGWITPASSDGGADFIGRLDVGTGLASTKIIVLGQAKCEKLDVPTGGNHIARTVARLRRGWIGAYVTTSYFSEAVQREVLEDKYPIILINGLRVATEIDAAMHESKISSIDLFLESIDETYDGQVMEREPEEILYGS